MNNNKHYIMIATWFLAGLLLTGCADGNTVATKQESEQEIQNMADTVTEKEAGEDTEAEHVAETDSGAGSADETEAGEVSGAGGESMESPKEPIQDDLYGNFQESGGEIACVMDGTLADGSYNEEICRGIQTYALAAGVSFSYYHIATEEEEPYEEVISRAAGNQAKIIVCSGYGFGEAVGKLQDVYPEVSFLMIDSVPVDAEGNPTEVSDNVHCVTFKEEEAGFLAGYMAVAEGYRRLGFIGGKKDPAVIRYGHGYLQGIDMAARDMGISDIEVNYWYSGSYEPEEKTEKRAKEWYGKGTEIIFACGGALYKSVLEAADQYDGMMIGVDSDQHGLSERFLTSAFKDIENAVIISLDDYYAMSGKWSEEFAGETKQYGVDNNCVGIPTLGTEWRFKNVALSGYYELYKEVKKKDVVISDEIDARPKTSVKVNYLK